MLCTGLRKGQERAILCDVSISAKKYQLALSYDDLNTDNEHNLEYQELKENYEATLSMLPLNQREVFLMSRMEELTYKEIAERLEISVKAVEKRMSLTLKELRKALSYDEQ